MRGRLGIGTEGVVGREHGFPILPPALRQYAFAPERPVPARRQRELECEPVEFLGRRVVRFFNVAPRGGALNSPDSVVAEEEGAQEVLYCLTNLMFRVQSYEPVPFQLAETAAELAPLQGNRWLDVEA